MQYMKFGHITEADKEYMERELMKLQESACKCTCKCRKEET